LFLFAPQKLWSRQFVPNTVQRRVGDI
jgi:hypothetical protein